MSDFLEENNLCGQTLLKIVSRGNAILANLLILKENIPQTFRLDTKAEVLKYGDIIVDLKYFSDAESFERKIEQNSTLQELDDELRESYIDVLSEFYVLFESIYKYIIDLNKFVEDIHDGLYIQMTLETILCDVEGRQLLVESLYVYGTMLLLLDKYIDGPIRERMITSFYRYSGLQHSETNIDDVCKLLRSSKKTPTYPQDYFSRVEPGPTFVQMLIGRLRSDDIYNQLGSYPLPEHRTTALASQASMLVIILSFAPSILQNETATMREICDKFFHDNWVIPVYMGFSINLIEYWDGYRAARTALEICKSTKFDEAKIKILVEDLRKVLKEGILVEDNVLEKANKVIALLRECNVILRWMMLHTAPLNPETSTKKSRQTRDQLLLLTKLDPEVILSLLLHIAELELRVKELFVKLLNEKESKWNGLKNEAKERIEELAEVFSGNKPLTRIERNDNLCQWLKTKATQIDSLDFQKLNYSGRKIIELIRALNDMLEYHNLESQVQVRDWVTETTGCLHRMLKTGAINEDTLVTLQIIGDLGYAWGNLIDNFTPQMQGLIHKDPFAVSKLRAVFLKLASAMDIPLMRLNQAKSVDLVKVSSYYSGELVSYVQKVLQIIPESVFSLLHEIIKIQTHSVKELPTRLDKDKVKDYAQLEARQQISRLTHDMSVLTEGILMMKSTLVGIIRIDPQVLLERGIRKELLRQLTLIMSISGSTTISKTAFDSKLLEIAKRVDGVKRSFEYIGDYVNSHGLKIFQEEINRLLNFATEQESNTWTKLKILPFQSVYQSKEVPIQLPKMDDPNVMTFLGKILDELITLTDPKTTVYIAETSSWYDIKSHTPIITMDSFKLMEEAIDIVGLQGLDKLLSFTIIKELNKLLKVIRTEVALNLEFLSSFHTELQPPSKVQSMNSYTSALLKFSKSSQTTQFLMKIGQLQLLRRGIQYQLQISGNLNSKQLYCALEVSNKLAAISLHSGMRNMEEFAYEVAIYSETFGIVEPLSKIYVTLKPIQHLTLVLAIISFQQMKKLSYSKRISSLVCRKASDCIDGMPFIIGVSTLLMQVHPGQTLAFVGYISQYLNSYLVQMGNSATIPRKDEELGACYNFIRLFIRYHPRKDSGKFVKLLVPSYDMVSSLINIIS